MPYGDQRYSDATGLLVGAGLLAAGLVVAQPDEKKRREREAREIRRLLFGRSDDGAAPELPLDEPPLPESSGDENWSEQIDQLCETLFHGEEEPEDLFTPEPPGAMHHACVGMPSPHATPDIPPVRTSRTATRTRTQRTTLTTRRHTPKRLPTAEPVKDRPSKSTVPHWRKLIVAACLLAGCLFFFRGLPSSSDRNERPMSPIVASSRGESRYVTSNIEDLRVGDWVLADNPELEETEYEYEAPAAVELDGWRTVGLRMAGQKRGQNYLRLTTA